MLLIQYHRSSKTDQDASAQETEGLVPTDVGFCQKQLLYGLDNSVIVSL